MNIDTSSIKIALVGIGPRGLGALEALAVAADKAKISVTVDVFDPTQWPGAGPNFSPDESDVCLLNVPFRDLDIDPPKMLPAELQGFGASADPDNFPTRAELGRHLNARFSALYDTPLNLRHHAQSILSLEWNRDGTWLSTDAGRAGPFDEVLLLQGQPETAPDPQLKKWQEHARNTDLDLQPAYPGHQLITSALDWSDQIVGVRGLGLSTFDVVRLLTIGLGGAFADGDYVRSGKEPSRIVPFSLNGHPPIPKPATEAVDSRFNLNGSEVTAFVDALVATQEAGPDVAVDLIAGALVSPVARVLDRSDDNDIVAWLDTEKSNPSDQETRSAVDALAAGIEMAHGRSAPSIGYTVGQMWRKLQNDLRRQFNPHEYDPETAAAIVGFDEGLKRYSYGPPVECAEQMLILINAGLVDLRVVDDPDITLDPIGWRLYEDDDAIQLSVMVDAVLPGPNLTNVTDPLVSNLRKQDVLVAITDDLGVRCASNAEVCTDSGLSLLGRLSLGSVIAADSLHDCFGASANRWVDGVLTRAGAD